MTGKAASVAEGVPFRIEIRALADLDTLVGDWEALAERALERNVFAEPAFALTAARHLADARGALAILIWDAESDDGAPTLVGLVPVVWPRLPLAPGLVRGWRSLQATLGVPLVDSRRGEAVIECLLAFLAERGPRCAGALFPLLTEDGAFARALANVAARSGRSLRHFDAHSRAVLRNGPGPEGAISRSVSAKKLKGLRWQLRRLGDLGDVSFERATDPRAVRDAVEIFLVLEASGWKSDRGTALIQDPGAAALARTMTRDLARQGRCHVDVLRAGEQPVAAVITLESGDRSFIWKIAYDEAFARFSPGVLLTLEITRRQLARDGVALTDSCAVAGHPMYDHVWRDRLGIVDTFVSTQPTPSAAGFVVAAAEAGRRALRGMAKKAYNQIREARERRRQGAGPAAAAEADAD